MDLSLEGCGDSNLVLVIPADLLLDRLTLELVGDDAVGLSADLTALDFGLKSALLVLNQLTSGVDRLDLVLLLLLDGLELLLLLLLLLKT